MTHREDKIIPARRGMIVVATLCSLLSACDGPIAVSSVGPGIVEPGASTWAEEIDVCVDATGDSPGCEWLAGLLIHRRCEVGSYQTFAAALSVGGSLGDLYKSAVEAGDCKQARS